MPQKMKAVRKVERGPGLVVEEIPLPEVAKDEVLVQVEAASICGTDLHIWEWDDWSSQNVNPSLTLGHEFVGTVVELGSAVGHVKVGDYVSAESHVTCDVCFQCRSGRRHMCARPSILGVHQDGAFADYIAVPEKVIWQNDRSKLPPEIATLQEPFGNAALTTLDHNLPAHSIGVLGCGPIGLFAIAIAIASGAASVLAVDLHEYRLDLARKMGASQVFNPGRDATAADIAGWLAKANEGYGVDIVLEMSGAATAVNAAFKGVVQGGRVTLFGLPSRPVTIEDMAGDMIFKNLTVNAVSGRRIFETWYKTRWLLESGVVDLRPIITHEMRVTEIDDAIELLRSGMAGKIIIRPEGLAGAGP